LCAASGSEKLPEKSKFGYEVEAKEWSFRVVGGNPTVGDGVCFRYCILEPVRVKLNIYDVSGRLVRRLLNEYKLPGDYEVRWDNNELSRGIYFLKFRAGDYKETKKLIKIRD
jgi:hypothetical protein